MKRALLVIDLQNDYFPGGLFPLWNTDAVLANICEAIRQAQQNGDVVIHIQHIADASQGIAPFFNEGTEGAEQYTCSILTDCCTTVSKILHLIALHAVSTRVRLATIADAFQTRA